MPSRPPRRQGGPPEGAVADDPGAQQGCRLGVGEDLGQGVGVGLVDDGELGVAPVGVPTGEGGRQAEVLVAATAEPARPARVAEPRDPDALADGEPRRTGAQLVDHADDLVTGRHIGATRGEIALGQVEVGPAHPAHRHPHAQLARSGMGLGTFDERERAVVDRPGAADDPRSHRLPQASLDHHRTWTPWPSSAT